MKTMTALVALALASLATAGRAQTTGIEERSLADIAAAMADGSASSETITQAYLDRIAAMDRTGPALRAVIALNPDAMAEARASDARRKAGKPAHHLTRTQKAKAKRRAKRAGRPYPNLVDNMQVAGAATRRRKATTKKTTKAARKQRR